MIKVNLLPQKRPKRVAAPGVPGDTALRDLMIGIGSLVAAGALVFVLVDLRLRGKLSDANQRNKQLAAAIADNQRNLVGYDVLQQENKEATTKLQAIDRLVKNRIVPANVLHELGYVLSTRGPTMTKRMGALLKADTGKQYQEDWDPTHVWLQAFSEKDGTFKLEGGAQSRDDITQLSKRLDASVYFADIALASGERVTDRDHGVSYYKFTITGKVAY